MEVIGTKGVVSVDAFNQKGTVYISGPKRQDIVYHAWGNNSDLAMIHAFIAALEGEENQGASGLDGLRATEVALAAYESIRTNAAVDLPLQPI